MCLKSATLTSAMTCGGGVQSGTKAVVLIAFPVLSWSWCWVRQVRNYIPSYLQVVNGGWNIADCVERAYDVEGMHVGTVAAGRIGLGVLRRLHPFGCKLHYVDRHRYADSSTLPQHLANSSSNTVMLPYRWHTHAPHAHPLVDIVSILSHSLG